MRHHYVLRDLSTPVAGFLGTLLIAAAVHAGEVRVTVNDRSAARHCIGSAGISAVPDGGSDTTIDIPLRPGQRSIAITLDDDQPWRVRARSDQCWSTTATWVASSGGNISVELFSSATLHGVFTTAPEKPPTALRASAFRIAPDQNNAAPLSEAEPLDCSLDLPKWHCTVPADLSIDVRLEPQGFAPAYLWNVVAQPGERRGVGPQKLVAGASMTGWVQDAEGIPLAGAIVTLAPLQPEHPAAGRAIAAQQSHRTRGVSFSSPAFRLVTIGSRHASQRSHLLSCPQSPCARSPQ